MGLLKETHVKRGRPCEQPASLVRPVWHCIRLFTSGARLRVRTCLFTPHCFLEGKVLQEQVAIMQLAAGWGSLLRSRWSAGLGAVMLAGSKVAGFLLRCCGEHGFLALCHAASFGAFATIWQSAFWSGVPESGTTTSFCFNFLGHHCSPTEWSRSRRGDWLDCQPSCSSGLLCGLGVRCGTSRGWATRQTK